MKKWLLGMTLETTMDNPACNKAGIMPKTWGNKRKDNRINIKQHANRLGRRVNPDRNHNLGYFFLQTPLFKLVAQTASYIRIDSALDFLSTRL